MPSRTYELFAKAMAERRPITCLYDGYRRELCPAILGHSKGHEVALAYQFGGESRSRLPPGGQWKCLYLTKVGDAALSDRPWQTGSGHGGLQNCVETVDLDVNPSSPYAPRRRLDARRRPAKRRR
jgi:hypothetical protein